MLRSWISRIVVGVVAVGALAIFWPGSEERPSAPTPPAAQAEGLASEKDLAPSPPKAVALPSPPSATAEPPTATPKPAPTEQAPAAQDDGTLMRRLREVQDSDPVLARQLAEEGQRRFPNSPDAAERAALGIKSLARQGRVSEARGEAERMVDEYPGTKWALDVERHTGAHPHKR